MQPAPVQASLLVPSPTECWLANRSHREVVLIGQATQKVIIYSGFRGSMAETSRCCSLHVTWEFIHTTSWGLCHLLSIHINPQDIEKSQFQNDKAVHARSTVRSGHPAPGAALLPSCAGACARESGALRDGGGMELSAAEENGAATRSVQKL